MPILRSLQRHRTPRGTRPPNPQSGLRAVLLMCAMGTLVACGDTPTMPGPAPALVLFNGQVVTMAAGGDLAQAVAIGDGRIVRVGSDRDVLDLVGPETRRIDLQGRTVLPGIVDAHTHLFNDAGRLETDLAGGQALLLENGITTLANAFVTPEFLEEMRAFESSGGLAARTSLYLNYTDNCGSRQGDWWKDHPPTRVFGERLRIGGIKIFTDGGTCGRPAVRVEFAPGTGLVDLLLTADDVAEAVAAAEQTGHQAIIHAIGDRAVEVAQDGIALALDGRPNTLRHRIDHNALVPADLISRYAEIGIQPVVFGPFPMLREMISEPGACGPSTRNEYYEQYLGNLRLLLDELPSLQVAWHGDDPWIGPINPFRELYLMVTRIRRWEGETIICMPEDWQLATAVTVEEGLRMMTLSSAYALFRETEVGSLEPGKLADLIVVTDNPLDVAPEDLWDIQVSMTMIDGEIVFCREGEEALCSQL